MPEDLQAALPVAIPLACEWAKEQERIILRTGVPLDPNGARIATAVGVKHPKLVRVQFVPMIPAPSHPFLAALAARVGLLSPRTSGITFNYGIYICMADCLDQNLLAHELVHVSQYEQLGGILPFMGRYCREMVTFGYENAAMELEAIEGAEQFS